MIVNEEDGISYFIEGLKAGGGVIDSSFLGLLFMTEGEDSQGISRLIAIAVSYHLGDYWQCSRAGTAGNTGDNEEGIGLKEALGGSYGVYNLVRVLFGDLSPQLIDFADPMTARPPTSDEDSMLIIRAYVFEPG